MSDEYDDQYDEGEEDYEEDAGEDPRDEEARLAQENVAHLPIPVGEVETEQTMVGTVKVTRSLSLGGKNDQVHLGIEIPFVVQPSWKPEEVAAHAADACFQAKATVYEQLGLQFTIDEGGVLREVIRHHFPDAKRVDEDEPLPRRDRAEPRQDRPKAKRSPTRDPHPADIERPEHIDEEEWDDLVENYEEEWYDNRARKRKGEFKATSPDFTRRSDRKGLWLKPFRREAHSRARRYDH
jgi:hypothetical protein